MKKTLLFAVPLLLGVFALLYWKSGAFGEKKEDTVRNATPIPVSVFKVPREKIEELIYVTGTIRAVDREYCYFQSGGKVIFVKQVPDAEGRMRDIREGDRVLKGELLAAIDPSTMEQELNVQKAMLMEAQAALNKAKVDFERYRILFEKQTVSRTEFEQYELAKVKAEMSVNTCLAKLKQAEISLEHLKIHAPCDGTIAYMNVKKGYYFAGDPGQGISSESDLLKTIPFILLRDSEMEMTCEVPASFADRLSTGLKAYIFYSVIEKGSERDERIEARVYSVNPAVDPGGRSIQVKIRTDKGAGIFKDGQYLSGIIISRFDENALAIPYKALIFQDNRPFCFIAENGFAKSRALLTGIEGSERIQISEGLSDGDLVVIDGKHRLVNASPISVSKHLGAPSP